MSDILLLSGSPQRKKILSQMGLTFDVLVPTCDETVYPGLKGKEIALSIARQKMDAGREIADSHYSFLISADTIIRKDTNVLGKPGTRADAKKMLESLQGKRHEVITGFCLYHCASDTLYSESSITKVSFASMSSKEIEEYLDTGEWNGAAGGYRIQGAGERYITELKGSYSNVVGLPIQRIYGMLSMFNYSFG